MTVTTLPHRIACCALAAGLAVSFHTAAQQLRSYPEKPVRVIVPFAEGGTPDHVSRRPARGDGVQPPGFIRVAAQLIPAYPEKPVRVIVPFAPGGGSDITARVMSNKLAEHFGQQLIIDNRPGAGGLVGVGLLVNSAPDGYTIMISTSSWMTAAAMHKPVWDPVNNITPIAEIGYNPLVLSVHPSLPAKATRDLIALARAKPGQLAYATPGVGSITHLAMELFIDMAKIQMLAVPYKSTGAVMTDLLAGQTQLILGGLVPLQPHIQSRKLRPLAVTTAKRWITLPDVPTLGETLPGYAVDSWYGVVAPKGLPPAVIERLNAAVNQILQEPAMKKNFEKEGMASSGGTPEQFVKRIRNDYERWVRIVKSANLKVE